MMTNLKSQQNSVNHIFNQNEFFFFLLTGDKDITMLYRSFTGYEHDILRVISYLHFPNLADNPKKKVNSTKFMEFFFPGLLIV